MLHSSRKDAVWALQWEPARTARAIEDLAGRGPIDRGAFGRILDPGDGCRRSIGSKCAARDSAGLHVLVTGHGLDLVDPDVARSSRVGARSALRARSVRVAGGHLGFVYKTAPNRPSSVTTPQHPRADPRDDLLRLALRSETAEPGGLAHTRWATVGNHLQPNAHPESRGAQPTPVGPMNGALNGEVDNYDDLEALEVV